MDSVTLGQLKDIVLWFTAFGGGIAAIYGFIVAPLIKQNERVEKLEKRYQEDEEDRKEIHEFMKVNFIALKELLKHNIDGGNNIEGMKMANNEIDKYLAKKI